MYRRSVATGHEIPSGQNRLVTFLTNARIIFIVLYIYWCIYRVRRNLDQEQHHYHTFPTFKVEEAKLKEIRDEN